MLRHKLYATVAAHKMFASGDLVVVGVSGGPDSMALLHSLTSLSRSLAVQLHVAHLNHMLRGVESTEDATYVVELARHLGWPITVVAHDVAAEQRHLKTSLEQAARLVRYNFFADVVRETGAVGVAVGHTADDQIETVVMHCVRGSGPAGMRGMRPITDLRLGDPKGAGAISVRVLRPMLDVTRSEVEAYCREHGLQPRDDATNQDPSFTRNRVRRDLLPRLYRFNPRFGEAIVRATRIFSADDDYLSSLVSSVWPTVATERQGAISFQVAEWQKLSRSLQYRLLRDAVSRMKGDILDLSITHLDAGIDAMSTKQAGTVVDWPHGLRLVKRYADFELSRGGRSHSALTTLGESLSIPGVTEVGDGRWRVTAKLGASNCCPVGENPWQTALDLAATGTSLKVRSRRPGDRFQPLGMAHEKKLQDFLVDAKVPRFERDDVPLVVNDSRIAWVAGMRPAEWAKARPESAQTLCLQFAPVATEPQTVGREGLL